MASAKRGKLPLFISMALAAMLNATNAFPMETEPRFNSLGLGQQSCARYLSDIASDQLAPQLYSAWLAGFMTVVEAQLPEAGVMPQDAEMSAASIWIKNYCIRRASDTYLTATVRLLAARDRSQY